MQLATALLLFAAAALGASETVVLPPAAPFTAGLRPRLQTWAQRFPLLRNLVERDARQAPSLIRTITNRGYLYYSHEAALQAIEGVEESMFDQFKEYMLSTLGVPRGPIADSIDTSVFQVVRWATNSDWVQFSATFSAGSMQTKYLCILGHRNIQRRNYDFVVADFKNTFTLAPDILVVTERRSSMWGLVGGSRTRIKLIPPTVKTEDMELLTNFFDMAAFTRFARMLDVPVPSSSLMQPTVEPGSIIAGVMIGLDMWERITGLFRTTITSRLLKQVMRTGFDYYVQRSVVQVVQGISGENMINGLLPLVPRMMRLEGEVSRDVSDAIRIGQWVEQFAFNKNDFLFNTRNDQMGNVRFVDVIISQPRMNVYNLVLLNVAQDFRMAPNIHIIEHSKSIAGGIFQKTRLEYRRVPRDLTQKDIEMLMAFFHITVFKRIALHMNIKINKPDPQIRLG